MDFRKTGLGIAALLCAAWSLAAGREWRDNTGKHRVEAEFVEVTEGQVVLRRPDGRLVKLPLSRLSKPDHEFLAQQAVAAPALPKLKPESQVESDRLVSDVAESLAAFADQTEFAEGELQQPVSAAVDLFLKRSRGLVAREGRKDAVVPALVAMLEHKNLAVRAAAAKAIGQIGEPAHAAAGALVELLSVSTAEVFVPARDTLIELGRTSPAASTSLVQMLAEGDDTASSQASYILKVALGNAQPALAPLAALARDLKVEPVRRVRALEALQAMCVTLDAQPGFGADPDSPEEQERAAVRRQVGEVAASLVDLISDEHSPVRPLAFRIVCIHSHDSLATLSGETLLRLLQEADYDFRSSLMDIVRGGSLRSRIPVQALVPLLKGTDVTLREMAFQILEGSGPDARQAVPALAELLASTDANLRWQAIDALGQIDFRSPPTLDSLPMLMLAVEADEGGGIGGLRVAGALLGGLEDLPAVLDAFVAEQAGVVQPDAVAILEGLLDDEDHEVRNKSIRALSQMGTPASVAALRRASTDSLRQHVREAAQNALQFVDEGDGGFSDSAAGPPRDESGEDATPFEEEVVADEDAAAETEDEEVDEDASDDESPFVEEAEPAAPSAAPIAVALTVDPALRAAEVAALLTAVADEPSVVGVKLVPLAQGTALPSWRIDLMSVTNAPAQVGLTVPIKAKADSDRRLASLVVTGPNAAPRTVRGFEVLGVVAADIVRGTVGLSYDAGFMDLPRSGRQGIGWDALPILADVTCDPALQSLELFRLLDAIASLPDEGGRRPLLQHLRLKVGSTAASRWFVEVIEPLPAP